MSNINARQVIKDNLIPALTSLGGTASTADVKAEILRMTNSVAEDYGRTKPNKKYPEGRLSFVEKFTLVSVEYKRKGLIFTPAYAHISLDQNAVVAGKKKPTKIAENHKSSKVKTPTVEEEVAEIEVVTHSEPVIAQSENVAMEMGDESIPWTKDESFVNDQFQNPVIDQSEAKEEAQAPTETLSVDEQEEETVVETPEPTVEEVIAEAEEIVEEVDSEEAHIEPASVEVIETDEDKEYIEPWSGAIIEAWLDRENGVKVGIDAKGREWKEELTYKELVEFGLGHNLEVANLEEEIAEEDDSEVDSVIVASTFDEGEVVSFEAPSIEDLIEDDDEEEDEGISVNTDLSFIFEEDEEDTASGEKLLLEKIKGYDLFGKIEGNEVYISMHEDGRVTLKFEESIPSVAKLGGDERAEKHHSKLNVLRGDLEGYAKLITDIKEARISKLKHQIEGALGCFGDDEWVGAICKSCALNTYCQSLEVRTSEH